MLKVAVAGATGRMGQMLLKEINKNPNIELVGALTRIGNPFVGQDVGIYIGEEPFNLFITDNPEAAFKNTDIIIDFSKPEGLELHLSDALRQNKPLLVCMTGLTETQKDMLKKASQTIPLLLAPNTSLGTALLRKMAVFAANILGPTYDISLLEMHHRHKADAPSGTSLLMAEALKDLQHLDKSVPPYPSLSPRPEGTIECATLRGGSVAGDHTVIFAGEKDMLKIEHRALDRSLFAQGAIAAAQWLFGKPYGFYSMDDVVGIS